MCFYRPDIDGLRAIAVLLVMLYHLGLSSFSGGFLGVDIFFVISGYLITNLLISEKKSTGKIDLRNFYLRRMRRLLPALFFTLTLTTIVACLIFTPQRLEIYGGSLLHSVFSVSNIYFFSESGYFDVDSSLKPLLHTWSLGVEEQFYLIWPALILFVVSGKFWTSIGFLIISLLSFWAAYYFIDAHSSAVFFLMPFRIFEFSIGAILVWLANYSSPNKIIINVLFLIGASLIIFSVFLYNKETQFFHVAVLAPCIGAALCIYSSEKAFLGKILRTKALVGIGLISYSLYLVHWPLIVFYKYSTHVEKIDVMASIFLLLISVLVAVLMYYFIEKPFRTKKTKNNKFLLSIVLLSVFTASIGASIWVTNGWGWRFWISNLLPLEAIKEGKEHRFQVRQAQCTQKGWDNCDALVKNQVNALIIGDSHAVDGLNGFNKILPSHNFSLSTLGGCPPYSDIEKITSPTHPDRLACVALNKERYNVNYLNKYDYIVISVLFDWYNAEHLREYLTFLKKNNIQKVIVIGNYFSVKEDLPELINKFGFVNADINKFIADTAKDDELKKYTEELGYLFLSKKNAFYHNGEYEFFDQNKVPFTYDQHHLSYEFAARIAINDKDRISRFLGKTYG